MLHNRMNFIKLHYANTDEWLINIEHINCVREMKNQPDGRDNGTWVYLVADNTPLKVTETMEQIKELMMKSYEECFTSE